MSMLLNHATLDTGGWLTLFPIMKDHQEVHEEHEVFSSVL